MTILKPMMATLMAGPAPTLDLDLTAEELDPRITFTRASTKTYFDADGLLKTAAVNEWPREFAPATGECLGRSVWEQRTNLAINSGALHTYATLASPIVTANAGVAPDGTNTATLVEVGAGQNSFDLRNVGPNTLVGDNANSIFFKPLGGAVGVLGVLRSNRAPTYCGVNIDTLAPATLNAAGISNSTVEVETLPNGWYRLKSGYTSDSAVENRIRLANSVAGAQVLLWGVQPEQGARFSSPYIPTAGSAVTRSADLPVVLNAPTAFGYVDAGTVFADITSYGPFDSGNRMAIQFSGGNTNERVFIYASNNLAGSWRGFIIDNGSSRFDASRAGYQRGVPAKVAMRFALGEAGIVFGGSVIASGAPVSMPTCDRLHLGHQVGNTNFLNGDMRRVRYWPIRITEAEMRGMTG